MSGKVRLLDSMKYNVFAGIEVRIEFGCWFFFSKAIEMIPNKDVGIHISVATATLNTFGEGIDDKSMLILYILFVASKVVLCSVFVVSLQFYIMRISLFTFTSELFLVIPSPSSRCVTWRCCFVFSSALSTYLSWRLSFMFLLKYLRAPEGSLSFFRSIICIINSCS